MTNVVVSCIGIITIFTAFIQSEYTLLLLALILPFEALFINFGVPGVNILTLILIPLCWIYIVRAKNPFAGQRIQYDSNKVIMLLMVTTTLTAFTPLFLIPNADYKSYDQLVELKRWFSYFALFFIYSHAIDDKNLANKVLLFIALGYSLETFYTLKDLLVHGRERLYGSLGNPNELGTYFSIFWVIVWVAICDLKKQSWLSHLLKITLFVAVFCLLRTLSRGSYLALIATFLTYAFHRSKKLFVVALLSIILLFVFYNTLLPDFMVNRINQSFTVESFDGGYQTGRNIQLDEGASRVVFWKSGLKMFADHPVLGVGFNQFPHWLVTYGREYGLTIPMNAHNMFVKMLAEQGIVGILAFLWLLWNGLRSASVLISSTEPSYRRLGIAFKVIIVGFIVSMMFGDRFFQGALVGNYFILAGIVRSSILQLKSGNEPRSYRVVD